MNSKILKLNLTNFVLDQEKFKIPFLHETWTWEGDESILPYKWAYIIKQTKIVDIKDEEGFNQMKDKLKREYYGLSNFDKKSFFFITYRSEITASAYLNVNNNNTIEYFLINPKYLNKNIEYGLFYLIYSRAMVLETKFIYIDMSKTNLPEIFFKNIGFI